MTPITATTKDVLLNLGHDAQSQYFKAIVAKVPADPVHKANEVGGRKFDGGKLDYTLVPYGAMDDVVAVLGFGAIKYGRDNWRKVERQRYVAAAFRHLTAIAKGELLDEESGEPHSAHLTCCSLFIGELDKAHA